ncbi:MAG: PIG-L family deacetylase [Polyangiaceae bacterium]|nr:PIG-L family deacetylase [Polyangiaceae bacterium]
MKSALTIAAVYAHPDDGEFFAAGSLIKWAQAGHKIYAICATNGDLGSKDAGADSAALGRQRTQELARALEVIGGEPPICLGLPDGFVRENAQKLKERLVYHFRKLKVDRVLTFDPWKRYEIHPDHIEVGKMAAEAACFSCFPLLYPEHGAQGLSAVQPSEVWFMMPTEHKPNRVVDIEKTFDTKVKSLLCHSSQMEMLADWFVPGADPRNLTPDQRTMIEGGARMFLEGMAQGLAALAPPLKLAEAFFAQRVGPGHFQNYQQMFMEMAGAPPESPEVL